MQDRETGTIWAHLDGKASTGSLAGERLTMIPLAMSTWGEWQRSYPDTKVLSADTDYASFYRPVQLGTYNPQEARFGDNRLPSNALVVAVEAGGQFMGYPLDALSQENGVVNDTLGGEPVLALFDPAAQSGIAYSRDLDGTTLQFYNGSPGSFELRDTATDTVWDSQGRAIDGPLAGSALTYLPSFISEWYGWSAYHPDTGLYAALP